MIVWAYLTIFTALFSWQLWWLHKRIQRIEERVGRIGMHARADEDRE